MHADASVGARLVFDPTGVESVVRFKLAPVWHRRAFEQPTGALFREEGLDDIIAAVGVAVGVCTVFGFLFENREISFWSG